MHRSSAIHKQKQFKTIRNKYSMSIDFDVRGQQGMDFFTGGSLVMVYYGLWTNILVRSKSLKVKCLNDGFVS